ncbi:MAG TPA: ComEC/Rec2 family competence protein, partial [Draconibacterium sp.]|nr:ComEC/Rec2 family competence protein [Draconibacterium sp.]
KLLNIYRSQHLGEEQFEILSALTLGYKRGLDPEIKTVFSSSGAMHVLAVSGLHVGIIYGVLLFILGFLKRRKAGRLLFVLLTLFCLWAFAFITGLSPSVERAATMFSLLVIGENLKRRINVYNSLAASAMLLLLLNPNNLFEVGFQLSYAAVFGIVFLQPKLAKTIKVKTKVGRFFWVLLTVSIAAQLATFPITLFYFNQFPTYFWLANLLVIPAVSILIPLGLSLLIFAKLPFIATLLSAIINFLIQGIYLILKQIEQLPFSVFHASIQPIELIFLLGLLLSLLFFLKQPRTRYINTGLICVLLLFISATFLKATRLNEKEIIVYNYPDNTILQLINGKNNYVISEKEIEKNEYAHNLLRATGEKLHLENPVYLTPSDTLINNHLFYESGIIIFGKQTILFEHVPSDVPEQFTPDFIINPKISNNSEWRTLKNSLVILNRSYISNTLLSPVRRYNVNQKGAFQKKW